MMNAHARKEMPDADMDREAWLSALIDGELEEDEAVRSIDRLGRDTDAARRWREYSLIGDAMRGLSGDQPGLEARIKAAIAAEPTVLAPVAHSHRQPAYWAAAAAAVVAITWTVLSVAPVGQEGGVPVASNNAVTAQATQAAAREVAANDVAPYLAAHQDYAFAVAGEPDMNITPVSMNEGAQ